MLVLNISILVYVMVNLVSEKLYRLGITQIGNTIEKQVNHRGWEDLASKTTDDILSVDKIFYNAPAEKQTKLRNDLYSITAIIDLGQKLHVVNKYGHEHSKHYSDMFKYIDLIIVDDIYRLKVQHLEQLRAIYDEHN